MPGWVESSGPRPSTPHSIPDILWSRAQGCPSLGLPVLLGHVRGRGCLSSERVRAAPASPDWAKSDRLVGREPAARDGEEEVDQRYGWAQKDGGRPGNSEGGDAGVGWCAHMHRCARVPGVRMRSHTCVHAHG